MSDAAQQHPHYYVDVTGLSKVDIYRLLELFGVNSPSMQHAIKKLLVAGQRGHKDAATDVNDAIKSLTRWVEMRAEDEALNAMKTSAYEEIKRPPRAYDLIETLTAISISSKSIPALTPGEVMSVGRRSGSMELSSATVRLHDHDNLVQLKISDFRIIGRRKVGDSDGGPG
jgi:hypothetical protein